MIEARLNIDLLCSRVIGQYFRYQTVHSPPWPVSEFWRMKTGWFCLEKLSTLAYCQENTETWTEKFSGTVNGELKDFSVVILKIYFEAALAFLIRKQNFRGFLRNKEKLVLKKIRLIYLSLKISWKKELKDYHW